MKTTKQSIILVLLMLTGCGWVDSTGNQDASAPALADSTLIILGTGDSFEINENTQRTLVFSGTDNRLSNWSWTLLDGQANIQRCLNFSNFEQQNASNSLSQSCASNGSCEVNVEEVLIENVTRFNVTTPLLRAAAALEFQFTAEDTNGQRIERRQLLCGIPINEAPDARDDRITMLRGSTLQVSGGDELSLIANDTDDQDLRNTELHVITTPVNSPSFASEFQLFSDGGFYYQPLPNAPLSSGGSISDGFSYAVSDGTNTSTANVSIAIINFNSAPIQNADIPEIKVTIAERDNDLEFVDLSFYFSDSENDELSFYADDDTLPASGNLYLTNEGFLKGNPLAFDSGRYFVNMNAADSFESVGANFFLNVVRSDGSNRKPYADDISNKSVKDEFSYDVSEFFGDADDDHLTFTATGLPQDVEITTNGIIIGTSNKFNEGTALIRVTANDGNGGTADDGFKLRFR